MPAVIHTNLINSLSVLFLSGDSSLTSHIDALCSAALNSPQFFSAAFFIKNSNCYQTHTLQCKLLCIFIKPIHCWLFIYWITPPEWPLLRRGFPIYRVLAHYKPVHRLVL
nr:MAG TPA: hypothetical protein [Bacteriophage sp.]